jgi:ribosomal protein L10
MAFRRPTTRLAWLPPITVQSPPRRYAISIAPAKVFPEKSVPRQYPEKKTFLYHRYMRLLETASSSTLIFFLHSGFDASRLSKLRKDIVVAAGHPAPSLASLSPSPVSSDQPTFSVLQTSVFGAAIRDFTSIDANSGEYFAKNVKGPLAVLSLPEMEPPLLNAVLRALDRGVPPKKAKTKEELEKDRREVGADPVNPGRRMKKVKADLHPELKVVGALVERRLFTPEGLRDVSKMPTLDGLRSQIVQLLQSPATQLVTVLSEASGGQLSRTLEGWKRILEEGHNSETP